jgi:hypothetical protein
LRRDRSCCGTDLHVVLNNDATDLGHFRVTPGNHIAEAILAEPAPRMNDRPVANEAVLDRTAAADRAVRADHDAGIEGHAGFEPRRRVDTRARRTLGGEHRPQLEQIGKQNAGDGDERAVRLADH